MSEYYAGMDCECMARGESECGCAADWTPKEVYKLRKKVAELEKQNTELAGHLSSHQRMASSGYYFTEEELNQTIKIKQAEAVRDFIEAAGGFAEIAGLAG